MKKKEPRWITLREALAIHDEQIAEFGGSSGIRDLGLLESALARAQNIYNYDPENASPVRLAAAYGFGLTSNHPFVDGNKRAALIVVYAFLKLNRVSLDATELEVYETFLSLAAGRIDESGLTRWLDNNTSRIVRKKRNRR